MKKLVTIALLLVATAAFAQSDLRVVDGWVKTFDDTNLVITQSNGKGEITITVTNKTSVMRGKRSDLTEGRRVAAKVTEEDRAVVVYVGEEVRQTEE